MEKQKLERILDSLIDGLKVYGEEEDHDNETYYVELLKGLELEEDSELFDEEYGMNEEEFARQAIEYDELRDKMYEFANLLVAANNDNELPLYRDSEENLFAGNYIIYELANEDNRGLKLYTDYIEFLPLYEYADQPIFAEVESLSKRWGDERTGQLQMNMRNSFNRDGFEDDDEEYYP